MIEIIKKFCGRSETNSEPFSDDDFTYATNGYMLIRVPRIPEISKQVPESLVAIRERRLTLPPEYFKEWADIPKLPEKIKCDACCGIGMVKECEECNGSGEITFYNSDNVYEVTCKGCEGDGNSPSSAEGSTNCTECNGEGSNMPNESFHIKGVSFTPSLLDLVKNLPNGKIGLRGKLEIQFFSFDGGDGILMPRSE